MSALRERPAAQQRPLPPASADTVARKIYRIRKRAGLTQQQLAKLVSTTTSVISRLEDADYEGHSLTMLHRIAAALDKRLEVRFVSVGRKTRVA